MPIDTLDCTVHMCGFPALDVAPMDQAIPKEVWVRWDGLQTHNPTTQQVQPVQSVSTVNYIKTIFVLKNFEKFPKILKYIQSCYLIINMLLKHF